MKGVSVTALKLCRQFYLAYPEIGQTLTDQFEIPLHKSISDVALHMKSLIGQTLSDQLIVSERQLERRRDTKRACKLLDSIYRKLPVGSLLVWETGADRRDLLRHAQEILPPFNDRNKKIWFLIDGQQRLSVLYRARKGGLFQNYNDQTIDFSHICFSFDERYDTYFIKNKRPVAKMHIPVIDIFSHNWRAKLNHLPKGKFHKIEECRDLTKNYEIPVIFIKTNNLEQVRESFLRVNSGGLRISSADRAFTKASRLNLRYLVNNLRSKLPRGFNAIERQVILFAAALILGEREVASRAVESALNRLEKEEIENGRVSKQFGRRWHGIGECISKAVDYLCTEIGLPNYEFLPSDNMIATLSLFFHVNNRAQPSSTQKRELRKWFWATAVGSRYAGRGYRQNILKDVDFFKKLGKKRSGHFYFREMVSVSDIKRTDYMVSSSLAVAFYLLLCERQPLYLENGSRIPLEEYASVSNRKDKHHIFPKALLQRNDFTAKQANTLCNICYIVAEENQSIGSNKPSTYLDKFRRRKHFARVMKSHLIPYETGGGLWSHNIRKGYRRFLNERVGLIRKAFEKEAGITLFRED